MGDALELPANIRHCDRSSLTLQGTLADPLRADKGLVYNHSVECKACHRCDRDSLAARASVKDFSRYNP